MTHRKTFNPKKNKFKQEKPATYIPKQSEIWRQAHEIRKKRQQENPGLPRLPPGYGLRPGYELDSIE